MMTRYHSQRLASVALAAAALAMPVLTGCQDLDDDDHYKDSSLQINNAAVEVVDMPSQDYLASHAEFASMNQLFASYGILDELAAKGQLSTILVTDNANYQSPEDVYPSGRGEADDRLQSKRVEYVRSHISDAAMPPSALTDGTRILMWHKKYTKVSVDEEGRQGNIIGHVAFNGATVKRIVKTGNGYIYVLDSNIVTPMSLLDFINELPGEYSIFKDLVLSAGGKVFDKAASKPIGIDPSGNTVYDSIFKTSFSYFENVDFDMNSESLTATVALPSDEVINEALTDAHNRLAKWGLEGYFADRQQEQRDLRVAYAKIQGHNNDEDAEMIKAKAYDILNQWILDVCFFNRTYSIEDLTVPQDPNNPKKLDVNSIFSKQWRKGAHTFDPDGSTQLSNAVVHRLSKLHVPTNQLIYRLKDHFRLYESCSAEEKASYFKLTNMVAEVKNDQSEAFNIWPNVWPAIEYRGVNMTKEDPDAGLRFDFTPLRQVLKGGNLAVEPYLIPPGAYQLSGGFNQSTALKMNISVFVNNEAVASKTTDFSGGLTTMHYDRGAGSYPEYYDSGYVKDMTGSSKSGNYGRDGGTLIDEVVIPDLNGDGSGVPVMIRFEADAWDSSGKAFFFHWCLRPTVNNY